MKKEKDLYSKLMYQRPTKIYQTYNTINRSNNILYVLCKNEYRRVKGPFGWYLTEIKVNESFVTCTKYNDGKYSVEVKQKNNDNGGRDEITTITGAQAKQIYERAKQYCK